MYKGICEVAPDSVVNFMKVNSFGNLHSSVIIALNDKVEAIITNRDHKYDEFILKLYNIMENSEELSRETNGERGPIFSKKIKQLH